MLFSHALSPTTQLKWSDTKVRRSAGLGEGLGRRRRQLRNERRIEPAIVNRTLTFRHPEMPPAVTSPTRPPPLFFVVNKLLLLLTDLRERLQRVPARIYCLHNAAVVIFGSGSGARVLFGERGCAPYCACKCKSRCEKWHDDGGTTVTHRDGDARTRYPQLVLDSSTRIVFYTAELWSEHEHRLNRKYIFTRSRRRK